MLRFTIRDVLIWTFLAAVLLAGVTGIYRARQRPPLIFRDRDGTPAREVKIK
jgi:hypothetical protein